MNVLLGTFWLSQVYGKAFMVMLPARLIKNVIKAPVDSIILYLVMTVLERAGVFRMLKIFRPGKVAYGDRKRSPASTKMTGGQNESEYSLHGDRQ